MKQYENARRIFRLCKGYNRAHCRGNEVIETVKKYIKDRKVFMTI